MLLDDLSKLFQTQRNSESGFLYLLFGCVYKLFTACFFYHNGHEVVFTKDTKRSVDSSRLVFSVSLA